MTTGSNIIIRNQNTLPVLVESDSLFSYMEKIKKFPILSEDEENRLVRDFQNTGNLEAAQRLVTSHLRLAAKIALTYRRYGLPMSDIISEANIGLMQAVKKFDLNKNVRLATYAIWWIKAAINDFVLRSWSLVKIGTVAAQKKLFYNLNRIKAKLGLYENTALEPKIVKEIARELVVDEKDVIEMNGRLGGDRSLNVAASDDSDDEKIDFLVDNRQNLEYNLSRKQEVSLKNRILYQCLSQLSEREQYILKHRLLVDDPVTLEDIGVRFAISRERVRQIEKKAYEKLASLVKLAMQSQM